MNRLHGVSVNAHRKLINCDSAPVKAGNIKGPRLPKCNICFRKTKCKREENKKKNLIR